MIVGSRAALETVLEALVAAGQMVRLVSETKVAKRALRSARRSIAVEVELTDMAGCRLLNRFRMYNEV